MANKAFARRIVLLVHYFPPINSAGAKRMEAMAKYFARAGRAVTVVTTRKTPTDGAFTEPMPEGVAIYQIDWLGRTSERSQPVPDRQLTSKMAASPETGFIVGSSGSNARDFRRLKNVVMAWMGQLPDPRLPFAFAFLSPLLDRNARDALASGDIIVCSCPPWPTLLAALFSRWRFRKPTVLDYRDHFSFCHEMPGSRFAKIVERWIDRALASRASGIITISKPMADYYAEFNSRVAVVPNGYDSEIIDEVRRTACWRPRASGEPLTVRYLGLISPGRVPANLLSALHVLHQAGKIADSSIRLEFYGECALLQQVLRANYPNLLTIFVFRRRVPYRESMQLAVTADHLLFCESSIRPKTSEARSSEGVMTTKLFEYLAAGRPVLADTDPNSLPARMIQNAGDQHFVCNRPDLFAKYLQERQFWFPVQTRVSPFVHAFSRAEQAKEYLRQLDCLSKLN